MDTFSSPRNSINSELRGMGRTPVKNNHDGDVLDTIREQVERCRHIASQLVANDNARSKGANMFFKRVKKAHTWEVPPLDASKECAVEEEDEEKMRQKLAETLLNSHERSATKNLSLVLNPCGRIHSLSSLKAKGIMVNEHDAVSPIIMSRLIKDLESPEANPRAFELFSKRKQMSQEWELVSNGTRDPKVSTLGVVEEKRVVEEEKENRKEEFVVPVLQPVLSQPVVNLRRSSSNVGRKTSVTSFDPNAGGANKRFSLLDPDYFVPAAGSSLAKSGMYVGSAAAGKAPLPWGVTRSSHSQTPEPVSHKILSSSTSASPAFSMIESTSAINNYLHSNSNYIPTTKPVSSSLASSTGQLYSMSNNTLNNSNLGLNSSNYGLNTAINNFNRNYYFNTLPSKSYGGSSNSLRSNGYENNSEVKLRRHDNYNKFCTSNNRKSANYTGYDYNKIMGITDNQLPRQPAAGQNPYANLPESILL